MIEKIILKKSAVLDKMPAAEQLDYGEIALNYNAEHPFLSFKDSDGDIMTLGDYDGDINNLYESKLYVSEFNLFKSDYDKFKSDNTKTINALDRNVSQNGSEIQNNTTAIATLNTTIEQKADKTELDAYAKLTDATQTILANKLKADDLILEGFSLNDLLNTANNNISRNTEYISNVELQKVNKTDIVQSTGTSTTAVMSQKAVTDIIGNIEQLLNSI